MNKYNNGLIYKLVCKDTTITDIYVGSTCDFNKRGREHKSNTHNINGDEYNCYKYEFIRKHGGWEKWDIIEITKYPCESKLELRTEERRYIDLLKSTLNIEIPTRTKKEYQQDNKEEIREKSKKYREENKEEISEKSKERYQEIVDLVRFGKNKLNIFSEKEYYEDHIDPNNGADWNQSAPIETKPTAQDFKKTVGDYLAWEIGTILKQQGEELGK